MLGRVRRSSIHSLEELELERDHTKLIKDDYHSIYETTLMKLKEGSRRDTSFPVEDSVDEHMSCITSGGSPREEASTINSDASGDPLVDFSGCRTTGSSRESMKSNFSLPYLFSRYRSSHLARSTPDEEVMEIENGSCSTNTSVCPNNQYLLSSSVQSSKQDCIGSPVT